MNIILIYKVINNTSIIFFPNKWTSDIKYRFKTHELYTNLKLKELLQYLPDNSYIIDVGDNRIYFIKYFYPKKI